MAKQLLLLDPEGTEGDRPASGPADWRLDAETREVGLRGIAEARRILAEAMRRTGEQRSAA